MMQKIPIHTLADLERYGKIISDSGMFPNINPAVGTIIATVCHCKGITPIEFADRYDFINGRVSKKAKRLLGEFQNAGGDYNLVTYDDAECTIEFTFKGHTLKLTQTLDRMRELGVATDKNGNLKDMWKKFPRQMLFARVVSEGVSVLAPSINSGLYTPEEVSDFDENEGTVEISQVGEGASAESPVSPSFVQAGDAAEVRKVAEAQPTEDPSICNIPSKWFGKKWEEIDNTAALEYAMTTDSRPSDEARKYIAQILEARKNQPQPAQEVAQ